MVVIRRTTYTPATPDKEDPLQGRLAAASPPSLLPIDENFGTWDLE